MINTVSVTQAYFKTEIAHNFHLQEENILLCLECKCCWLNPPASLCRGRHWKQN